MGALRSLGPHLIDVLDAALGPIQQVQAHGDPAGWWPDDGTRPGRFSEASLTATANVTTSRADIEIFGSGGSAAVEAEAAVGPARYDHHVPRVRRGVTAGTPPGLDARPCPGPGVTGKPSGPGRSGADSGGLVGQGGQGFGG